MDEIEKYETFMRGAFTMLEGIRMQVAKNKPSYADDIEEQTLTPCEEEWKQALALYREFNIKEYKKRDKNILDGYMFYFSDL